MCHPRLGVLEARLELGAEAVGWRVVVTRAPLFIAAGPAGSEVSVGPVGVDVIVLALVGDGVVLLLLVAAGDGAGAGLVLPVHFAHGC